MQKLFWLIFLIVSFPVWAQAQSGLMRVPNVLALPVEPPEAVIPYGPDTLQFGELRLPAGGNGPYPVVVIIHGGCWLAAYDLHLMDAMATALRRQGYASWNLEYRRVGDPKGGWPNTFLDVAKGINHLREIAEEYPLDLEHVVVIGHSAGGHLALWSAAQGQLPENSELAFPDPLPLSGVVSLAGIVDLESYLDREGRSCGSSVDELIGGLPEEMQGRYQQASPLHLAPLGVPQVLISGMKDPTVPLSHVNPYYRKAKSKGDRVKLKKVKNAGHFEVIAPGSTAWPEVVRAVRKLIKQ